MKKILLLFATLAFIFVGACSNSEEGHTDEGKLRVISSFTIITDIAEIIGGEHVEVHNLVPTGTDPHEYEPKPTDIKNTEDAGIIFYNGLNLEGGKEGWLGKLTRSVDFDEDKMYQVTEGVEPKNISDEDGNEEVNPHSFIDPHVGVIMAENIRDGLVEEDPDHAEYYEDNAKEYIERLNKVIEAYDETLGNLPKEDRVFVASERAFTYLMDQYDIEEGYIWAIDTDENGAPSQIKSAVNFVKEHKPNHLFVESNVDTRPMETVSKETGVEIYEKPIYSDEIGKKGDEVDTYMKYLEYNLDVLANGLKK